MYEKHKRKLMMELQVADDEMYQRRRKCWLIYGRAILTIAVLGLLTVVLYSMTKSSPDEEHFSKVRVIVVDDRSGSHEDESVKSFKSDEIALSDDLNRHRKLVKRNVDASRERVSFEMPKNIESGEQSAQSLNDVDEDSEPKLDSQHLTLFRRQGASENVRHRHADGIVYYIKGYKCVPIRKPSSSPQELRAPQRAGTLS
jgi:hypothetical protein